MSFFPAFASFSGTFPFIYYSTWTGPIVLVLRRDQAGIWKKLNIRFTSTHRSHMFHYLLLIHLGLNWTSRLKLITHNICRAGQISRLREEKKNFTFKHFLLNFFMFNLEGKEFSPWVSIVMQGSILWHFRPACDFSQNQVSSSCQKIARTEKDSWRLQKRFRVLFVRGVIG